MKYQHLINDDLLKYSEVRLVGENIDEPGIYKSQTALQFANDLELDLVCISTNTSPVVCRICSYEKFLYQQKKREKEQKAKTVKIETKELRFTPTISEHDFNFKVKHAKEFLQKGNKVKILVFFSGREIKYTHQGEEVLNKIISELSDISNIEQRPKMEGRRMISILTPKK